MAQFYADRVAIGSHRAKTPEGYLVCLGVPFARTGFQTYKARDLDLKGDGEVKVYRRYDEVFHPSTIASFEGKSITNPHPPRFLNPDNDATFAKGHIQNVRPGPQLADGEHALLGDLVIKDSRLISQIESGSLSELSAGYQCEYEPDEHSKDIYYQLSIRGNHLAVVPAGRAGAAIKILDAQPEGKETIVAETVSVTEEKVSFGTLKAIADWLRGQSRYTTDSDPGAVERNEEKNEEALRRAKVRNDDKSKVRDAEEDDPKELELKKKKAKEEITDAVKSAVKDAMEEYKKEEKSKKEEEDEEEEEKEKSKKKKEEDADLISVETLPVGDRPKNPIPGADSKRALDCVLGLKSLVSDSGDKTAMELFNDAVRALKGKKPTSDGYSLLARPKKSEIVKSSEDMSVVRPVHDSSVCDDFVETARKFHRKNPGEAAAELSTAGKEKK